MADQTTSEDSFWKQSTSRCSKIGSWTSRRHWVAFVAAGCPRPVYLHTLQMQAEQPCNFHNIAAGRLWKSETSNISVAATIEWVACSHPDRGASLLLRTFSTRGECLESTKRMQIESDTPCKEAAMHVQLFNSRYSREKAHMNAHILRLS